MPRSAPRRGGATAAAAAAAALLPAPPGAAGTEGVRYRCGPLSNGARCDGDRSGGEPTACPAGDASTCVSCCEARGVPGCCEWSDGRATETATPNYTAWSDGLGFPGSSPPDSWINASCYFFADGVAVGGADRRALTCAAVTLTATPTPSASATDTQSVPVADVSCAGNDVYPSEAAVGRNFTLTVFCRKGISGEALFFTQTAGYCDDADAELLGPTGDVSVAPLQYRDEEGHPFAVVPAIHEPATYQVCLRTVRGLAEPLGPPLRLVAPRPRDFVWLQNGAGADAAFRLTVDGLGLDGMQFAIATDDRCALRVRETDRVGAFIDAGDGAEGAHHPGASVATRWTGYVPARFGGRGPKQIREDHQHCPGARCVHEEVELRRQLVWHDTHGHPSLLRRGATPETVFAEDPGGGYDVTADGTLAVTTATLAAGTYWHCYRRFDDEGWEAHARFMVRPKELTRVATTPRELSPGQPFLLTVFGPGTTNLTGDSCRVAPVGTECATSPTVASDSFVLDDTLVCRFPAGTPQGGWFHACVGALNSTTHPGDYRDMAHWRGDHDGTPGGATFVVWSPPWPTAEVSPPEPTTREWFTVSLAGGDFPAGSFVKLVDGQDCGEANLTEETAEVAVRDFTGAMVLIEEDGDPCGFDFSGRRWDTTWAKHPHRGIELMPTTGTGGGNSFFHMCPVGQVVTGEPLLICPYDDPAAAFAGTVRADDHATCHRIGGRWHLPNTTEQSYGDGRRRCDIALCRAQRGLYCPGPGCRVRGGLSVQGYGHCLEHHLAFVAFQATAENCDSFYGRWGEWGCWLELCDAALIPDDWHPHSHPLVLPTRWHVPRRVSAPLMLRRPAYPVHICGKRQHGDPGGWQWLGAFGVADSCRVARAKACRRIACGSGALAVAPRQPWDGAGEYNPGPCAVLGAEGADEDARGIGPPPGHAHEPDTGSWQPIGARATRLSRPVEPSAVLGPVTWNKRLHGPSAALQRVCAAFACADAPGGARAGRPGDPAPARFGGRWPALRHRWLVPSPDGLQVRLLLPPAQPAPHAGDELHVLTRQPLDVDAYGELPIGFSFHGLHPKTLRMGLLSNSSLWPGAFPGRFHNASVTPLQFQVEFDGEKCVLQEDTRYRFVLRLRPPEAAVWSEAGNLQCHLRHPSSLEELIDEGWRLAFVLTWPSLPTRLPLSRGRARIVLHP